jgi:hypothetical protein
VPITRPDSMVPNISRFNAMLITLPIAARMIADAFGNRYYISLNLNTDIKYVLLPDRTRGLARVWAYLKQLPSGWSGPLMILPSRTIYRTLTWNMTFSIGQIWPRRSVKVRSPLHDLVWPRVISCIDGHGSVPNPRSTSSDMGKDCITSSRPFTRPLCTSPWFPLSMTAPQLRHWSRRKIWYRSWLSPIATQARIYGSWHRSTTAKGDARQNTLNLSVTLQEPQFCRWNPSRNWWHFTKKTWLADYLYSSLACEIPSALSSVLWYTSSL